LDDGRRLDTPDGGAVNVLEYVFGVIVFLLLALILAAVAVAPVLAIISLTRLRRVERRLQLLEGRGAAPLMEALPVGEVDPARPGPVPARPPRRRLTTAMPIGMSEQDRVRIESFIGRRVLAWVAAALLVLAAAFFLNYALQSKMIGPAGQIATVAVVAA